MGWGFLLTERVQLSIIPDHSRPVWSNALFGLGLLFPKLSRATPSAG